MNVWKWVMVAGCSYEIAALHERSPLPTISTLANRFNEHPVLRFATWAWCGAFAWHFMAQPVVRVDI